MNTFEQKPPPLHVEELGDHAVIRPTGYLNALTGDQIYKACTEMIERDIHYFIINFCEVSMVNTIGISILIGILEKVLQCNGLVYFTELGSTERRIFEVLNLTTVALTFNSDEDAHRHLIHDQAAVRRADQSTQAQSVPIEEPAPEPAPESRQSAI